MRTEGRASRPLVATAHASGYGTPSARASSYQTANWRNGSATRSSSVSVRVRLTLPEEVEVLGDRNVCRRALSLELQAADHRARNGAVLAHHELGRGRELVGDCDLRRAQLAAARVARATQVEERGEAGDADRDVDGALAPRPAERVAHDHTDGRAGKLADPLADSRRAGVRVVRQQDDGSF